MGVTFYKIVLYIPVLFFIMSAYAFLTSIYAFVCARKEKKCTQKGTATLIRVLVRITLRQSARTKPRSPSGLMHAFCSPVMRFLATMATVRTDSSAD